MTVTAVVELGYPFVIWTALKEKDTVLQTAEPDERDTSLNIGKDGTATVVGHVVENIKQCSVDLTCYLKVKVHDKEVHIVYVPDDGQQCVNEQASRQGFATKKGDLIKAHGQYRKQDQVHIVSTCSSKAFYIKILPSSGRGE
jgi:hypothetical protein